ncbi:helix-turn-helix domain-containing protein [Aquimarina sp. W85]|uniref:helix-turn-helix domain-containing protein n=1 Tax=Aquimarina rhodophyticola TaxID=3342246 RepID=UPI00366D439F
MSIGKNIQTIRTKLGLLQKEVALELDLDKSSYSKVEKDMREVKVSELKILSNLFNMSIDDIINHDENTTPKEVILEDKSENEQFKLINQLDEEDKSTILKIIDTMLTKKKFKDFFNKNVSSL